jgi:hypothetical protein
LSINCWRGGRHKTQLGGAGTAKHRGGNIGDKYLTRYYGSPSREVLDNGPLPTGTEKIIELQKFALELQEVDA